MDLELLLPKSDIQVLRFPVKLRRIIDACVTEAIRWNQDGTIISINKTLFEREYLTKDCRPFQTTSFSSFIRQLNFYGFQKVNQRTFVEGSVNLDPNVFDYRHPHFRRNSADLSLVQRKNKSRRPRNFEDAFARVIEPSTKSFGTWLPFRRSRPKDITHISKEVVDASPPVQLYMVGRDGILVPVNTGTFSQPTESGPNNQEITNLHESTVQLMDLLATGSNK